MKKVIDLSGNKYGKLTVLRRDMDKKRIYYICQCECGNIVSIRDDSLKNGTTSCGCNRSKNLVGKKFGRLEVLEKIGLKKGRNLWLCQCECGNFKKATTQDLTSEHVRSCGCLQKETSSKNIKKGASQYLKKNCKEGTFLAKIDNPNLLKNNTSGTTGVFYDRYNKKWTAVIELQGVKHKLGRFKSKEMAIKVRKNAEKEYFEPLIKKIKEHNSKR